MKILLAADCDIESNMLGNLNALAIKVDLADPFSEVGSIAQHSGPYDAVLLYVRSISPVVRAVLRGIRARKLQMPVLVIAMRTNPEEELDALNVGADDVLTMPVSPGIITARLKAVHRRTLGHVSSVLMCGNVTLDQVHRRVIVDGRRAAITARETQILELLLLRQNMVLSKEHFLDRLYSEGELPDQRVLDVFVCKLRRKLAAVGAAEIIRTLWGTGYVAEEPSPTELRAARERFAAGEPRRRRAHLQRMDEPRLAVA